MPYPRTANPAHLVRTGKWITWWLPMTRCPAKYTEAFQPWVRYDEDLNGPLDAPPYCAAGGCFSYRDEVLALMDWGRGGWTDFRV